ncbi:MAG: hypothetical protein WCP39_02670 [Chlamydiota bacterium]
MRISTYEAQSRVVEHPKKLFTALEKVAGAVSFLCVTYGFFSKSKTVMCIGMLPVGALIVRRFFSLFQGRSSEVVKREASRTFESLRSSTVSNPVLLTPSQVTPFPSYILASPPVFSEQRQVPVFSRPYIVSPPIGEGRPFFSSFISRESRSFDGIPERILSQRNEAPVFSKPPIVPAPSPLGRSPVGERTPLFTSSLISRVNRPPVSSQRNEVSEPPRQTTLVPSPTPSGRAAVGSRKRTS